MRCEHLSGAHDGPRINAWEYILPQWIRPKLPRGEDGMTERERVLALLRRHGWNSTSFQVLEPGFRYWFDRDDACVGYVDTGRAWVVAGPPIAPADRLAEVAARFADAAPRCRSLHRMVRHRAAFSSATTWPALRIGDQPVWSPAARRPASSRGQEPARATTARAGQGRDRARDRARRELAADHPARAQVETLIVRWLASRPIAPMGFLVVDPFTFPAERRYFVAEREGKVLAFLGIIPIYARDGWFFEDFLRDPDAPNGTVGLLVGAGMHAAAAAGIPIVHTRTRAARRWRRLVAACRASPRWSSTTLMACVRFESKFEALGVGPDLSILPAERERVRRPLRHPQGLRAWWPPAVRPRDFPPRPRRRRTRARRAPRRVDRAPRTPERRPLLPPPRLSVRLGRVRRWPWRRAVRARRSLAPSPSPTSSPLPSPSPPR